MKFAIETQVHGIGPTTWHKLIMDARSAYSLSEVHVMFCECYLLIYFLWTHYARAQLNGDSRNFYTWWILSVNGEVTTWIFSWSSLNYRVGHKVTKFGIFSDPARKLSAITPERGRIL